MTTFNIGDRVIHISRGEARITAVSEEGLWMLALFAGNDIPERVWRGDLTLLPDTVTVQIQRSTAEKVAHYDRAPLDARWHADFRAACREALATPTPATRVENGITITDFGDGRVMREWPNGSRAYYLYGKSLTKSEWAAQVAAMKEEG